MKLLLDEVHSALIARELRQRGFDVIAVQEIRELRQMTDTDFLDAAVSLASALVTENVKDFAEIVKTWAAAGKEHCGVIFTSPRRFPRSSIRYPGILITALDNFLVTQTPVGQSWIHWL